MRKAWTCAALAALLAATAPQRAAPASALFPSAGAEIASRADAIASARAFIGSSTPTTPDAMATWLRRYDALLVELQRHDIYVYLRAEEDDRDTADAGADDALGSLQNRLDDRVVAAARTLGQVTIARWTMAKSLAPYRYLLESSLAAGAHRLSAADARSVDAAITPILTAAARTYKALRASSPAIAERQDAFAALLVSIAAANNGLAVLRGFSGAPQASYFDKSLAPESVERALRAVRASTAYAAYRKVSQLARTPLQTPPPIPLGRAAELIVDAAKPMGPQYAAAYAALTSPANGRLEICTSEHCDKTGFSLGFVGVPSIVFYAGYDGSTNSARALSHESGHAVHREFMSQHQNIAAYNEGPHFLFESFAIFNELLFLEHLYRTAASNSDRAFYLDSFLGDATFQVFGSAEETDLESAIYRGVADGSLRTAEDFNGLTVRTFSVYDPTVSADAGAKLYWARDRLFFTDPLYDVNYLYAGLLALRYFAAFERDPRGFSPRYVAFLKNGFDDSPAVLEKRFLGIDLNNEPALVASADALLKGRTSVLAALYAQEAPVKR
ncbi:MAG: hypothetical protein JO277_06700 [Candidatus Eremiobacteraeota bacterium]|nr:hypothetical protein [Candidatus Eremiobacteraeota bacterium]